MKGQPPLWRSKQLHELFDRIDKEGFDIVERRVGRPGFVGIQIYGDTESLERSAMDFAVEEIQSSMNKISGETVEEWKNMANRRSCICWSVILFLALLYFWDIISFPISFTAPSF